MVVIEAIRTGCWNAITGQRTVVTVETRARELRSGDRLGSGYVTVDEEQMRRAAVLEVPAEAVVDFQLWYPDADGLDPGERDLLALAATRADGFRLCSADKAAVRGGTHVGMDRPRRVP
ncbi:MAG: hypothetical protein AB1505_11320 [Candidatus Latescibacterota bacterium]